MTDTSEDRVDLRLLGRQMTDLRLRFGHLEARVNEGARDIKVLLLMAHNHDEALKDINRQLGELIGAMNGRLSAIEDRIEQ